MAFKSNAQRGAFFEKEKQQGLAGKPAGFGAPRPPKPMGASPISPMNAMAGIPKVAPIAPAKPLGSFEKLKNSIKIGRGY